MKRVDELEWDFKTTFSDRSARRLTLTDTGQSYLTHARQLLRSYSDMASGAILSWRHRRPDQNQPGGADPARALAICLQLPC